MRHAILFLLLVQASSALADTEATNCTNCNHPKRGLEKIISFYSDVYKALTNAPRKTIECKSIDLSQKPALKQRKYLRQASGQFCSAFAFADVLSSNLDTPISAMDIMFSAAEIKGLESDSEFILANFKIDQIQDAINKHGVCPENELNVPYWGGIQSADLIVPTLISFNIAVKEDSSEHLKYGLESGLFRNLSFSKEIKSLSKENSNFSRFMLKLAQKNCKEKRTHPKVQALGTAMPFLRREKLKFLDNLRVSINNGKAVVLGLNSSVQNHAVSLVGTRSVKGKCEYIIRDSASSKLNTIETYSEEEMMNMVRSSFQVSVISGH